MSDDTVSLQAAAELLAVHYMTAYRYVRLGLLPAAKQGGVWRISEADLAAFMEQASAAAVEPTRPRSKAPWSERLEARLLVGDARGAWGVVEAALASGAELQEIYLEVLSPAMVSIGARWAAGEVDVATEHRASGIAMQLVARLGPRFVRRGRTRGAVILCTAPNERHSISLAMLADLARAEGFDVSDLGADLPVESLARLVSETADLVAVGLSAMTPGNDANVRAATARLRLVAPRVPIMLGGYAVRDGHHAESLGAHRFAVDGKQFVEVLDQVAAERVGRMSDG